MAETTTVTEWKSAFSLNPPHTDGAAYQTIAKADGTYYWVVTSQLPEKLSSDTFGGTNGLHSNYCYQLSDSSWIEIEDTDLPFHQVIDGLHYIVFPKSSFAAQSWNSSELRSTYYPRDSFDARVVPAPVGNAFDSIYTVDLLGGILSVLPLVLAALIGYVAIRKGILFVSSLLKRG